MKRTRVLLLVGLLAAGIFAAPAAGSEVTGKAGTDTSLKTTDSKATVAGRGKFADVKVTVNQTKNLLNQAVSVTWTGADPTRIGPGRFGANYMQLMQCWGDDDGSVASNPGPPPSQCVFGASNSAFGGVSGGLFPQGSYTTERIISVEGWKSFNKNDGVYEPETRWVWQPFKGVSGATTGSHYDPNYNPAEESSTYWRNPFFNIITTNEIAAGRTGPNGTGAELFEVNTGVESSGLGCGQRVEKAADGSPRVPKCWLVLVPRGLPADENADTQFEEDADQFGVMTSPLSPNSWKNRISIPLEFTPVDSSCSLSDDQRRIAGSELIVPAVASWQLKLCQTAGRKPYAYGLIADSSARQQLLNPAPGSPGMVVVSRPVDQEVLDPDNPITYAPLTLSGVVIGFNVERFPQPSSDASAKQLAGVRVAEINLTPRLLAKLLTQSYRTQVEIKSQPSPYVWVKKNPQHLGADKDFLQFNPEFSELVIPGGKNFGGLIMPAGNSDAARQVWEYILADAEAKQWLDGEPDEFGMNVNPLYATSGTVNPAGSPFGDPTPSSFPKSDPYCYQGPAVGPNRDVVPPQLCGTDWLPYAQSFRDDARLTRAADDGAKIVEDPGATSPDKVYKRDLPQQIGNRIMLSLTDSASAFQYGVQSARLSRAGDNGKDRRFVTADAPGYTAAYEAMKTGTEKAVVEPDPRASAPNGYPLTAITYAAITPLSLEPDARKDYAEFVSYAAGEGQVAGFGDGKLPEGYAPLPAALQTQAANAAKTIVELTAASAPILQGEASNPVGPIDSSGDSPNSFSSSGFSPSTGFASNDPATATSPAVQAATKLTPAARRTLTPAVSVPFTRFVMPMLAALAAAAAFGAVQIGRRSRLEDAL